MYQESLNMALTEFAVSRAIKELSEQRDTFTYEDIASHIGCHWLTVYRACKKLMETGTVNRVGNSRNGYRYTFNEDANAHSQRIS